MAPTQPDEPVMPPPPTDLETSFDELQDTLGGDIGVAFAPVGRPDAIQQLGSWTHGPAWSTSKVPLSVALLRQDGAGAIDGTVRAAITQSDNSAAQAIWEALGAHQTAADKVDAVLREAGDQQTHVQPEVTRSGFSAFGQTDWSLTEQVRFMSYAACDGRDAPVLTLMGEVSPDQGWGLGTLDDVRFKGGWGPGTDGLYLVRQFGVVTTPEGGGTVVAMAAVADSGGFGDGTALLDRMAEWVDEHLVGIGGGRCGEA
jgi:hypothetical protein